MDSETLTRNKKHVELPAEVCYSLSRGDSTVLLPAERTHVIYRSCCLLAACVAVSESQWVPGFPASDLEVRVAEKV